MKHHEINLENFVKQKLQNVFQLSPFQIIRYAYKLNILIFFTAAQLVLLQTI